jgi:L-seryl-tRNA(Ser) seleniumtransferase
VALRSDAAPTALMRALRAHDPPVIGRIHDGRVLLDPRTLEEADIEPTIAAARSALEN